MLATNFARQGWMCDTVPNRREELAGLRVQVHKGISIDPSRRLNLLMGLIQTGIGSVLALLYNIYRYSGSGLYVNSLVKIRLHGQWISI